MTQYTVLGASGFIGGHLAARLAKDGHEVLRPPRAELKSFAGRRLGHVFYCLGTDDVKNDPYGAFDAHAAHLANFLKTAHFASLTYISSTRLYLGTQSGTEDSPIKILPSDDGAIFNAMKIAAEQLCFATDNSGVRVVRLSNVIGFAPDGISLIPALIRDAMLRGRMRLTISQKSAKDYLDVEDVLDILPRIAVAGSQRCYNVASGFNVPLAEIVAVIHDEFPCACYWRSAAPTIIFPEIDISRVRTEFSFTARPIRPALLSACAEFRRQFTPPAIKASVLSGPT